MPNIDKKIFVKRNKGSEYVYTVRLVRQNNSKYRYIVFWKGENWVKVCFCKILDNIQIGV